MTLLFLQLCLYLCGNILTDSIVDVWYAHREVHDIYIVACLSDGGDGIHQLCLYRLELLLLELLKLLALDLQVLLKLLELL